MKRVFISALFSVAAVTGMADVPAHLNCCPDGGCCIPVPKARPDKVAKVMSGELKKARASWWGFDRSDATECLQAAISSGVPELVVDFLGVPWIVRPLKGVSNQTIIFEHGVELVAKKGGYIGLTDTMLAYLNAKNVKLLGEGATLRMHREDYAKAPYVKGEWRHLLSICGGRNVLVEGLRLADSGGDGIYVGMKGTSQIPKNITLRNLVLDRNWRNALSVIAVDGMLIENCSFLNTAGTLPEAGIDFEPNRPSEYVVKCVVRNCISDNNRGKAFGINATASGAETVPYDIRFENCRASRSKWGWSYTDGRNPRDRHRAWNGGTVEFENCTFENNELQGVGVYRKQYSSAKLVLKNCRLVDNCVKQPERADMYFTVSGHHDHPADGYVLDNVTVKQPVAREWLETSDKGEKLPGNITRISGRVEVAGAAGGTSAVSLDDAWSAARFRTAPARIGAIPPPRTPVDYSKLTPVDPLAGEFRPLKPVYLRGNNQCAFFAADAGEVSFDVIQRTIGKRPLRKDWMTVFDVATGRSVGRMPFPVTAGAARVSVNVPARGFYGIRFSTGGNGIAFAGASVPLAIDTTGSAAYLYRAEGDFGFFAAEDDEFGLLMNGVGIEYVQAEIVSPSGAGVWGGVVDENGVYKVLGRGCEVGVWTLRLSEPDAPFEDCSVELCGPRGFLFLDKDRYWK